MDSGDTEMYTFGGAYQTGHQFPVLGDQIQMTVFLNGPMEYASISEWYIAAQFDYVDYVEDGEFDGYGEPKYELSLKTVSEHGFKNMMETLFHQAS